MSHSESSSSNRTLLIIVIVVGLLIVAALAICLAGVVYLGIQGVSQAVKPMQEMMEDMAKAPDVADAFLADVRANKLEAAHQSTTEAFKKRMSLKQFEKLVEKHPALKERADSNLEMDEGAGGQANPFGGVYRFRHKAKGKDGKDEVEFTLTVTKENGQLKVDDLKVFQAVNP